MLSQAGHRRIVRPLPPANNSAQRWRLRVGISRSFDFLGYRFSSTGLVGIAVQTVERCVERTSQLYEQGAGPTRRIPRSRKPGKPDRIPPGSVPSKAGIWRYQSAFSLHIGMSSRCFDAVPILVVLRKQRDADKNAPQSIPEARMEKVSGESFDPVPRNLRQGNVRRTRHR